MARCRITYLPGEKSDTKANNYVEKVIDKKTYNGEIYYQIKWQDPTKVPTWHREPSYSCDMRTKIKEFKADKSKYKGAFEDEDEWEVEEILDKRKHKGKTQYLVRWKGWSGGDTWQDEEDCECHNLIAAFENPKLKKLWNFQGNEQRLWLDQDEMLRYMKNFLIKNRTKDVTLLKFKCDSPLNEKPLKIRDGLNIGPLSYENHWYLIIIVKNFINVTKKMFIGDSLNTLFGSKIKYHPVVKRLSSVYEYLPIKQIRMTQMERSDVCAYYTLAAFERAVKLMNKNAPFIVERLFFDINRAELIRCKVKPETKGCISVSLPIPEGNNDWPKCEFCEELCDNEGVLERHIRKHFSRFSTRESLEDSSEEDEMEE